MADVKGDLSGIAKPGGAQRQGRGAARSRSSVEAEFAGCPVEFWDVFGKSGHPVRATVSDMGPLLLGRMLDLNETQAGVLGLVFKIADDNGLLLLDLKDLRAMLQYVGDNAAQFKTAVRQRLDRRRSAPSSAACSRSRAGRGAVLRRADARHRRPDAACARARASSTSSPPTS